MTVAEAEAKGVSTFDQFKSEDGYESRGHQASV